jgi:hypothetical protein
MQLKSDLWVRAHLRRCLANGLMGAVVRKGSAEAGAIFVKVNHLDGFTEEGMRRWMRLLAAERASESAADSYLAREARIDPDIWVVEIEDRVGRGLMENIE